MEKPQEQVTAFYNGACPVCRAGMTSYCEVATRQDLPLAFRDVAQDSRQAATLGITPDAALRRLHALDGDGRLHIGFDAMLLVWRGMPRTRPLARLYSLPLVKPVAAWLYEHVVSWSLYHWANRRLARQAASGRA